MFANKLNDSLHDRSSPITIGAKKKITLSSSAEQHTSPIYESRNKLNAKERSKSLLSLKVRSSSSSGEKSKMSPVIKIYSKAKNFVVKSFDHKSENKRVSRERDENSGDLENMFDQKSINSKRLGGKFESRINLIDDDKDTDTNKINDNIKSDWYLHIEDIAENKDFVRYVENENGEKILHAATFNELVKKLVNPNHTDLGYMKIFLLSYKSFATASLLLQKILEIYDLNFRDEEFLRLKVRTKCINVLVAWLDEAFNDFDESMISKLKLFVENIKTSNPAFSEKLLRSLLSHTLGIYQKPTYQFNEHAPSPKIPKDVSNLLNINPIELARQITLLDFENYSNIKYHEFLNQSWTNPKLKHKSANVLKMIKRFNGLSKFVILHILSEKIMKQRKKKFSYFIDVAWNLYEMKNYCGAIAIVSGLDNSAVYRLKHTKEKIKESNLQKYEILRQLTDSTSSFKNYRDQLSRVTQPCIPHMGILLTDLTFIEDGNQETIDHNLINFHKKRLLLKNIFSFIMNQQVPFNFHKVDSIQDFINREIEKYEGYDEIELYQISLILEPRGWNGESLNGIATSF